MLSTLFKRTGLSALAAVAALALLGLAAPVQAQQGVVTGQVVDASNMQPIQGAQVTIQGTQLGALSGQDGRYRITGVPAGDRTVRVRLLGYRTGTRAVTVESGETVTADFELQVSAVELEQVVVTATGERRVREVGHAVSTVDAADAVEKAAPQNLTNLLKGRSTGISVQRSSGSVGTGDLIKIRGNSSIGLSNVPIIIVDGARIDNDNDTGPAVGGQDASLLNDLNPEDIESVEILKGPAAAALYGTAAATGVIRITTKQGSASGATRYTFRGDLGVNRKSLIEWPSQFFRGNAFGFGKDTLYEMNLLLEDVSPTPALRDIYRAPFRDGVIQAYGGTVRGGNEDMTFFLSGEFQPEEGNLPNNEFDKYTARANFNITPSENLDISVSSGFHSNFLNLPDNDNNGFGYIGIALVGFPWETPITQADPATGQPTETCPLQFELARAFGLPIPVAANFAGCSDNPFFGDRTPNDVATLVNEQHTERFTGSASGTYRPFDFLTARATIGYDEVSNDVPQLIPVDPERPFGSFSQGFKTSFQNESRNITLDGSATANFDLSEDLNSKTTAGVQWFREVEEATFGTGQTLPAGCTVLSCAVTTTGGETFVEEINAGFFFQEQLGYKDRFFLTGSVRFDDNSAFGENLGLQTLPSVTASYAMSDEEWFPEFFNSFRVRGAWGKAGVQPGPFDAFRLLGFQRTTFQEQNLAGVTVTDPGNPDLKTETGEEFEFGVDMSILDGRLSLESTYYDQTTSDAIVFQDLKPSTGFPGQQPTNVGEITSSGFEFSLDAQALQAEDLSWNWRVNLTTNDGEITELSEPIIFGLGGSSQRHKQGFPFASYFTERITVEGGEVVVGDSASFHGHPTPEWEGSVATTISMFDRITVYGQLDFAGGHQNFNATEEFRCGFLGGGAFGSVCGASFTRGPDGEFTEEARKKHVASDILSEGPWIEDADYAKLRSVSVRFDVPESWLSAFSASRASVTLIGENLASFTGYTGLDPEINFGGSGSEATRADFLTLPPAQRYLAQVSLTF